MGRGLPGNTVFSSEMAFLPPEGKSPYADGNNKFLDNFTIP